MPDITNEEKPKLEDFILDASDFEDALHTNQPDRPKMPPNKLKEFMQRLPLEVSKQVNGVCRYFLSSDWSGDLKVLDETGAEIPLQDFLHVLSDTDFDLQQQIDEQIEAAADESELRIAAEQQLQKNIDGEAQTRLKADEALGKALSAEEKARTDTDKDLQKQIAALAGDPSGGIVTQINGETGIVTLTSADILDPQTNTPVSEDIKTLKENPSDPQERTELDDIQIMRGALVNAGAGWNSFEFPASADGTQVVFDELPDVFLQTESDNTIINVRNVTKTGFQYQVRKFAEGDSGNVVSGNVIAASYYTAAGTASSSAHTANTLVNSVTLPTITMPTASKMQTTADAVKIHWFAVSRKY